jgi:hypothetical protein
VIPASGISKSSNSTVPEPPSGDTPNNRSIKSTFFLRSQSLAPFAPVGRCTARASLESVSRTSWTAVEIVSPLMGSILVSQWSHLSRLRHVAPPPETVRDPTSFDAFVESPASHIAELSSKTLRRSMTVLRVASILHFLHVV